MNNEFVREERYIVFKVSDLGNSLKGDEIRKLAEEYADTGRAECLRYGEKWRDLVGDKMVLALFDELVEARVRAEAAKAEAESLRAKIEQMEQQAPVATVIKEGDSRYWMSERLWTFPDGKYPLYALPGAKGE